MARWERLQSSCQRTTSPARSRYASISASGVSQTVSASGILSRSAAVSGGPSSIVKANRPPVGSALEISWSSVPLSGKASIVSSRSTTSNGPGGIGGMRETSKRQGGRRRAPVRCRWRWRLGPPPGRSNPAPGDEPPGPGDSAAEVQYGHPGCDAGPHRQGADLCGAHEALLLDELAGAYADTRARWSALSNGARSSWFTAAAHPRLAGCQPAAGSLGVAQESWLA